MAAIFVSSFKENFFIPDILPRLRLFVQQSLVMSYFGAIFKSFHSTVPLRRRATFILDKLFPHYDSIFEGFTHDLFSKILDNCTKDNVFLFDEQLNAQRDICRFS